MLLPGQPTTNPTVVSAKCCRPCLCHVHACMFYWARKYTINLWRAPVCDKNAADGISGTPSVLFTLHSRYS
jgi:hypothetical protein